MKPFGLRKGIMRPARGPNKKCRRPGLKFKVKYGSLKHHCKNFYSIKTTQRVSDNETLGITITKVERLCQNTCYGHKQEGPNDMK